MGNSAYGMASVVLQNTGSACSATLPAFSQGAFCCITDGARPTANTMAAGSFTF